MRIRIKKKYINNQGHFIPRHTNGFHICAPKHTRAPHGVELNGVGVVGMITWTTGSATDDWSPLNAGVNTCPRKCMCVGEKKRSIACYYIAMSTKTDYLITHRM